MRKKDSLLNQIKKALKQPEQYFIKFYVKDQFYKQIRCDNLKPGMFINDDSMILFFNMDQEDTVTIQADQATCDAMINFLCNSDR